MAKVTFTLRDKHATGVTAIFCKLRYGSSTSTIRTRESIKPSEWNPKTRRSKVGASGAPDWDSLNGRLDDIESRAKEEFRAYVKEHRNEPPQADIKRIIEHKLFGDPNTKKIPHDFHGYWKHFIKSQKRKINDRTNRPISLRRFQEYHRTNELLKEYESWTKDYKYISFNSIDLGFYWDFREFLEKEKQFAINTVGKFINVLKTVLNEAIADGVNTNFKFKSKKFRAPREANDDIYLNDDEIQLITNVDLFQNDRLNTARNQFLLLYWTGQRYSDLHHVLNPSNRRITPDGEYITFTQSKTNNEVTIPVFDETKRLLATTRREPISNVKLNKYIKEVGAMIPRFSSNATKSFTKGGIKQIVSKPLYSLISTHCARRSFVTNMLDKGLSEREVSAITGHKKLDVTRMYDKAKSDEHARRFLKKYKKKTGKILSLNG